MALPYLFDIALTRMRIALYSQFQWQASFFIELATSALWMAVYLVFWSTVSKSFGNFEGWTLGSLVVFVAFQELFYGFSVGLFQGANGYWWYIHTGRLEISLTRPLDPRLNAIATNVDPYQLIRSLIMFTVFMVIGANLGFEFDLLRLIVAIALAFAAAVGKTLLALSINFVAFWWANVDALHEIIGSGDHFLRIPLDILPKGLQLFFTFGIPYMFAATFPALFSAQKLLWLDLLVPMAGLMLSLTALYFIQDLLWRRGVRRYEGRGG